MPKEPTQIADMDTIAQAELVAKGECGPNEAVEAGIARIEERNPELNAVIHFTFDGSNGRANEKQGEATGAENANAPFKGVPMVYKDLMCTSAGDPHHCGARALKKRGATSQVNSYMDQSFRGAGFEILGRTNTPEFGMSPTTEPLAYGPTLNPWDKTRSPSGSSGGSAVAVAAGMVPVAHGNDAGGSIRMPASACGLVGLKPTRGRISVGPEFGDAGPLSHQGVLTRSVRDSAAVLDIVEGMRAGDPYTAPPPLRPYLEEQKDSLKKLKGLKAGFMTSVAGGQEELHPECKVAVENACKMLEELGCVVEPSFPERLKVPSPAEFGSVMNMNQLNRLAYWGKELGEPFPIEELEPATAFMVERGQNFTSTDAFQAMEGLSAYSREVCGWWDEGFDILVTPTLPTIPWKLGELGPEGDPMTILPNMAKITRFTSPFNATGQPAISLPLYWTDNKVETEANKATKDKETDGVPSLPIGVQLVAKFGRDDLLFQLAFALEEQAGGFGLPEYC